MQICRVLHTCGLLLLLERISVPLKFVGDWDSSLLLPEWHLCCPGMWVRKVGNPGLLGLLFPVCNLHPTCEQGMGIWNKLPRHEEGHSGEREHRSSGPCLPEIKLKNEAGASEMTCLSQGETIILDSEPGGMELMLSWSNPLSIECQNRVSVEWVWGWDRGSISWLKCLRLSLFLLILSRIS